MPSPINAPRYHVVRDENGNHWPMCSTDNLNSFRIGHGRANLDDAVSDCVRLAAITSQPAPVGMRVWEETP